MTSRLLSKRPQGEGDCDRLLSLHRRATMLDRCSARLVVTIHDLLLISIFGDTIEVVLVESDTTQFNQMGNIQWTKILELYIYSNHR
jgi:hypothetical protein